MIRFSVRTIYERPISFVPLAIRKKGVFEVGGEKAVCDFDRGCLFLGEPSRLIAESNPSRKDSNTKRLSRRFSTSDKSSEISITKKGVRKFSFDVSPTSSRKNYPFLVDKEYKGVVIPDVVEMKLINIKSWRKEIFLDVNCDSKYADLSQALGVLVAHVFFDLVRDTGSHI